MRPKILIVLILALLAPSCVSKPQLVRVKRDINLPADNLFHDPDDTGWSGRIDKGSECIESFRKGRVVYVRCPVVLDKELIEQVEEQQ